MSIIFHAHITFGNFIYLITCGDYEAQNYTVFFARRSLPVPHFFRILFSDTLYETLHFTDQNSHAVICTVTMRSLARYYT